MIWISVKEAADLLSYTTRTIRNKALQGDYQMRYVLSSGGRGGRKIEILLDSLPKIAKNAYLKFSDSDSCSILNIEHTSTIKQKEKGKLRAEVITEYKKYRKRSKKKGLIKEGEIREKFIMEWNDTHEFKITSKSLYDWQKKSKSGNPDKLIDRRGGYNRGLSKIPEKYQLLFEKLYLIESKPSIQSCYDEIKFKADKNKDYIPGIKAFRNYAKNLNPALITRYRDGEKKFVDSCLPYSERDYSQIMPNDIWVADHHLWDIFVRVQDNNGSWKVVRPWGSYWMDMRTRKIMSSIIRVEDPNSDIVLVSFSNGVEHFGVPKRVLLDNGKDYKAKDLFQTDMNNKNYADSLAIHLGIDVTYAIPYNAKAKPIERVFRTFEERLSKKYPSYAGRNAKQRPEELKNFNIMDFITLEEFIHQHNLFVYEIYNETSHNGNDMFGNSPNQLYSKLDFTVRRINPDLLYFCLLRLKGYRTIGRNGITFNKSHFYNENCINHFNKKVIVKYDPTKPEIVYIFDLNENFLFIATKVVKMGFAPSENEYERENSIKKIARQKALNSYTKDNTIRSTNTIGERLEAISAGIEKAPIAKTKTIEVIRNEVMEENIKRFNYSDSEREYYDALRNIENKKRKVSEKQKEFGDRFKKKFTELGYRKQA